MFRRLCAAAFVPLFLPRGWNTRLGGAAAVAAAAGAHRGMKPRPPYLRFSVDWEVEKSPGVCEAGRSPILFPDND